jgi:hypothetical protein
MAVIIPAGVVPGNRPVSPVCWVPGSGPEVAGPGVADRPLEVRVCLS